MVLLSAQRMPVPKIAEVTFTSEDRVRDVIHDFNADGFDLLYPKYAGGRPHTFNLPESPHLAAKRCRRVADWAEANNVEIAYVPTNSSWLNRIEAQFTALRYFALDGTDHRSHKEQKSMIRRCMVWRNRHTDDIRLRQITTRANVA
ncbi:hypothetical protein AB0L06_28030 [Spirillospora sp. NPDC052269]